MVGVDKLPYKILVAVGEIGGAEEEERRRQTQSDAMW
jgi:hypothetical protein